MARFFTVVRLFEIDTSAEPLLVMSVRDDWVELVVYSLPKQRQVAIIRAVSAVKRRLSRSRIPTHPTSTGFFVVVTTRSKEYPVATNSLTFSARL